MLCTNKWLNVYILWTLNFYIPIFRGNKNSRHASTYRPPRYLDHSPDSYYEIPNPPSTMKTHSASKSIYSTSDSDSDFATPQASPKFNRSPILANKRNQQSYQDLRRSTNQLTDRRSQSAQRPGHVNSSGELKRNIPPRKSLDPIPTPRKSSRNRMSKHSNPRDPHYKSPSKVPIPIKGANQRELRKVQLLNLNMRIEDLTRDHHASSRFSSDESTCVEDSDSSSSDIYAEIDIKPKKEVKKIKTAEIKNLKKTRKDKNPYEEVKPLPKKIELEVEEYNPYDEITPRVKRKSQKSVKKSREQHIEKKESRKVSSSDKSDSSSVKYAKPTPKSKRKKTEEQEPEENRDYIPVEMPMRPDWFNDLQPKDKSAAPQPKSIVDGVLYTSGLYLDDEGKKESKPISFNLIKPEIFEMYDVCQKDKVEEIPDQMIEDHEDDIADVRHEQVQDNTQEKVK